MVIPGGWLFLMSEVALCPTHTDTSRAQIRGRESLRVRGGNGMRSSTDLASVDGRIWTIDGRIWTQIRGRGPLRVRGGNCALRPHCEDHVPRSRTCDEVFVSLLSPETLNQKP